MMNRIISFQRPPLVESVLSVQFGQLPAFSSLHAGRYWSEVLGVNEWPEANEVGYIEDKFEQFGEEGRWAPPPRLKIAASPVPNRAQFRTASGDRMIQVQQSRFILNWLRRNGEYPRYSVLREEFDREYAKFVEFASSLGIEEPTPNQWEVTYVNHLVRGEDWESLEDWSKVFPTLQVPPSAGETVVPDVVSLDSIYLIEGDRGRLRTSFRRAKHKESDQEVIRLDLTARGRLGGDAATEVLDGLDVGHQVIVETFVAISSDYAHSKWGRTE